MKKLIRFGVSLDKNLLSRFDHLVRERKYTSRSEAIRDLIRQELVQKQWQKGARIAGAITIVYDHHKRQLVNKLLEIQHDFGELIISSQHIHLDHHNCFEIIAVKGAPGEADRLASRLKSITGVKHVALSMATTGTGL